MSDFKKVAVVGESDLVFPFRALGIKVYSPKSIGEARRVMEKLDEENIALCFLHQGYFEPLKEERMALGKKFCPVVIGFSDYRKVIDELDIMLREMALKATGTESLVKRKG